MKKNLIRRLSQTVLLAVLLVMFFPQTVSASSNYSSWIQDSDAYKDFYNEASLVERDDSTPTQEEEGFLVQQLGNLVHWIGTAAAKGMQSGSINLTIDGIVFGKLAQPSGISYTSFDLTEGNIYGIIGATIYTIFRGFTYSGLFIFFLVLLAKSLFSTSPKAKEDLKQGIYGIVISFTLIYALPQITDLVIFLRDQFLYRIASTMMLSDASILDTMDAMYTAEPSLIRAIVYLATVGASIIYLKDYISIAIQQTLLFGFFCVFNLLGTQKKKFLTDWASLFFSNMLVPIIDVTCLLMPYKAIEAFTSGGRSVTFGGGIIIMFMLWTARTCRSQLLRLFGNMTGTPAGRGLGGLAMMGMAAMRAMKGGASNTFGSRDGHYGREGYSEWKEEAARQKETAIDMNRQAGEITRDLPSIDNMMDNNNPYSPRSITDEELGVGSYDTAEGISEDMKGGESEIAEEGLEDAHNAEKGNLNEDYIAEEGIGVNELPEEDITTDGSTGESKPEEEFSTEDKSTDEVPTEVQSGSSPNSNALENANGETPIDPEGAKEDIPVASPSNTKSLNTDAESNLPPMSDFEKSRYSNLQAMDSLQTSINDDKAQLKATEDTLGAGISTKRDNVQKKEQELREIDREMNLQSRELSNPKLSPSEQADAESKLDDLKQRRSVVQENLNTARNELKTAEDKYSQETTPIKERIASKEEMLQQRSSAERQFAQVSRENGRDGTKFSSAKDMRLAMDTRQKNNERALEEAKKKAGMSIRDLRGLSPETAAQVAEIQKENIRKANLQRIASGAGKTVVKTAAAVSLGTAAGAFIAYGGEDVSIQAAVVGAAAGVGLVNKSTKVAHTIAENKEEIIDDAIIAGTHVQNASKKVAQGAVKATKAAQEAMTRKTPSQTAKGEKVQQTPKRINIKGKPHMESVANTAYEEIKKNAGQKANKDTSKRINLEGKPHTEEVANLAYEEIKKNKKDT